MNQDHVVGGGIAVVLSSNLPAVLGWLQGPDAPVSAETALIIAIGAVVYGGLRYLLNRRSPVSPGAPAPAAEPAS